MDAVPTDPSLHEPNPTLQDLKRLLWAVALIELVIAGLALLTRAYFGARLAMFVGLGIGGLVLAAFVLVVGFSLGATAVEELVGRRARRRDDSLGPPSRPAT
jgi:hypothetical protein